MLRGAHQLARTAALATAVIAAHGTAVGQSNAAPQPAAESTTATTTATANDARDYDALIRDGVHEYAAGNFAEARALFERAHAVKPNARTLRGLGVTAFELKRYVESLRELQAALEDTRNPLTEAQRQEMNGLLPKARSFVGHVRLEYGLHPAEVYVDDRPVLTGRDLWLDLGTYRVSIRAPGHREARLELVIEGGEDMVQRVELVPLELSPQLAALPPSSASAMPQVSSEPPRDEPVTGQWWFWTSIGAVVAGGTVVALAVALSGDEAKVEPLYEGSAGALRGP